MPSQPSPFMPQLTCRSAQDRGTQPVNPSVMIVIPLSSMPIGGPSSGNVASERPPSNTLVPAGLPHEATATTAMPTIASRPTHRPKLRMFMCIGVLPPALAVARAIQASTLWA